MCKTKTEMFHPEFFLLANNYLLPVAYTRGFSGKFGKKYLRALCLLDRREIDFIN